MSVGMRSRKINGRRPSVKRPKKVSSNREQPSVRQTEKTPNAAKKFHQCRISLSLENLNLLLAIHIHKLRQQEKKINLAQLSTSLRVKLPHVV